MKRQIPFLFFFITASTLLLISCKKDLQHAPATTNDLVSAAPQARVATAAISTTSWMQSLPNNYLLSQLSVPGSHDAGARYEPVSGTAKCQSLTIAEQLNAGIRFLDIRCRHIDNAYAIHHGSIYQNLNFDDVLNACITFLTSNPGECIIMSVKEEYDPSNNTRSFEQTFDAYTQKNPSRWYLGAAIPNLGSVRGKIVLVRRFGAATTPKGIAATSWADNTTFTINNSESQLRVQDNYVVPDNNVKWTNVTNLLTEAKNSTNTATLFINFTSGYKSLIFSIPSITTVSNNINTRITSYFTTNTQGRFGIIPMDFSDANKASLIAQTNF